jgi:hypothetical protein
VPYNGPTTEPARPGDEVMITPNGIASALP